MPNSSQSARLTGTILNADLRSTLDTRAAGPTAEIIRMAVNGCVVQCETVLRYVIIDTVARGCREVKDHALFPIFLWDYPNP